MANRVISETLRNQGGTRQDFVGVGIGSPGPLDLSTGVILMTPNLGWEGYPIRDRISDAVELPATLDNDANCAALGEAFAPCNNGGCAVCRETPLPERPAGAARAMLTLQTGVDTLSYAFSEGLKNDVGALTGISPARIQIVKITSKSTIPPSTKLPFSMSWT